ncbi:MAG: hypothetical protein LUF29_01435 [Oscillospiraceae bacterium]|nr:hypothetical protein [Oscillospiraceae bacterium]
MKNKLQGVFTVSVIVVLILSLIYIDEVKDGITKAIENCITGIVPSLFLNSVLSGVLIKCSTNMKPKRISSSDYGILLAFLLGNICGYPIGAKILSDLVKENNITHEQAEKAICFSFASGPAYVLGIVSTVLFHAKLLGFTTFVSIFLSNMVLYIAYIFRCRKSDCTNSACKAVCFTEAVMESISSSANSMISICSAIVFFSAMIAILKVIVPSVNAKISAILEISNITSLQGNGLLFFVLVTLLLSFGGLCVHMQIICLAGGSFSFRWFYLTRPIQLLLTALFSSLGYLIVSDHISIETSLNSDNIELTSAGNIIPFICICGMVLIALTYKKSDRT